MRLARVRDDGGGAFYHCISRVVDGRFIFETLNPNAPGALEANEFVRLMRKLEDFHGMRIVTYALMGNHFHILVQEPLERLTDISDDELARKVGELNGADAGNQLFAKLRQLRGEFQIPQAAEAIKATYLKRMGDVSSFFKELKGRFAQWYNRRHDRYGVLWAERFRSLLVEGNREALLAVAAYIDLNAVRAGLVGDPADYRYCGYGEAVSGGSNWAREGLRLALGEAVGTWQELQAAYRCLIYGLGEERRDSEGELLRRGIPADRVALVDAAAGEIPLPELLRKRVRHFTTGMVLGRREFVEEVFARHRERFHLRRPAMARKLVSSCIGELQVLRALHR